MKAKKASQVFKVHPHVNNVWITEDGHFHLHPYKGGDQFNRETVDELSEDEEKKESKANNTKK
jgi:diadenosine tetraphosphate (Ap4A) HIT family hydrolase